MLSAPLWQLRLLHWTLAVSRATAELLLLLNDGALLGLLGGLGLLIPKVRKAAAWGLIALLIAVYPANIHMLVNEVYLEDMPKEKWLLWVRMPFQFLFAAGVLWTGNIWPKPRATAEPVDTP